MKSRQQPKKMIAFSFTTSNTFINTIMAEVIKVSMPSQSHLEYILYLHISYHFTPSLLQNVTEIAVNMCISEEFFQNIEIIIVFSISKTEITGGGVLD